MRDDELRFPYMVWAHTEAFLSPWSLAQSGMPSPDPAVLGPAPPLDLSPPAADALPSLAARLGELFGIRAEGAGGSEGAARLLVTLGASSAMQLAAQRWFRPGARVVTELPSYEPFRALPPAAGAELRVVERRLEDGWRLPLEAVERELAGAERGHVFVANPHNPTGALASADEVRELARLAADRGGVLVSNEVYMELARPDERVHAFALAENAVSIGSLTKAYGLGALRVGWMILGEGLASELPFLRDLAYLDFVDPPTPVLRLATRALDRLPELLRPTRAFEAECAPVLARWLAESAEVEGVPPRLGLAAFARVRGVSDTRALARHLAREQGVDAVPGEFFGLGGHLRVGYAVPRETLVEGLRRLDAGVASFRGR